MIDSLNDSAPTSPSPHARSRAAAENAALLRAWKRALTRRAIVDLARALPEILIELRARRRDLARLGGPGFLADFHAFDDFPSDDRRGGTQCKKTPR